MVSCPLVPKIFVSDLITLVNCQPWQSTPTVQRFSNPGITVNPYPEIGFKSMTVWRIETMCQPEFDGIGVALHDTQVDRYIVGRPGDRMIKRQIEFRKQLFDEAVIALIKLQKVCQSARSTAAGTGGCGGRGRKHRSTIR